LTTFRDAVRCWPGSLPRYEVAGAGLVPARRKDAMADRSNKVAERVEIAVSLEMAELRETQKILNDFLWTSEISYGYLLSQGRTAFADMNQPTIDVLGHVLTEAWYPSNQGRIKFDETIGNTLGQITLNTVHVYRAVVILFASAFENYLDKRVGPLRSNKGQGKWGPYFKNLALPELIQPSTALQFRTILLADISRRIRNCMVHPPFSVPDSLTHPLLIEWRTSFKNNISPSEWPKANDGRIDSAFRQVVGHAVDKMDEARKRGKSLPVELFYAIFNFTNLDNLACEIEEALIPLNTTPDGRATRKKDYVRRTDLIVSSGADLSSKRGGTSPAPTN